MNNKQLRRYILSHVPSAKYLAAEERMKPRPGTDRFWDRPKALRPLKFSGSPYIVALIEILCDHLQKTSGGAAKENRDAEPHRG
ncbi:hypothetical protein M3P21_21020 [Ruegeria sp. 2012CJ41-6]|uniref:Uncharacterized protein n=1 Tax=Ruegeria spongiae TaxID=2942209 RepID=A0ABT0Q7Z7_9RHOB|nr:hypothetical protein [Ruegeria spongiae]MCL6286001.1 hypothetical protein [Ruegeria spongiae]